MTEKFKLTRKSTGLMHGNHALQRTASRHSSRPCYDLKMFHNLTTVNPLGDETASLMANIDVYENNKISRHPIWERKEDKIIAIKSCAKRISPFSITANLKKLIFDAFN